MDRRPRCGHCKRAFTPNHRVRERECPWEPGSRFQRFCAQTPECRTASRKFTQAEYRSREPEDPTKTKMRRLKSRTARRALREPQLGAHRASSDGSAAGPRHPAPGGPPTSAPHPASLVQEVEEAVPADGSKDAHRQVLAARIRRESSGIAQLLLASERDI
jgi:hypothetical protein